MNNINNIKRVKCLCIQDFQIVPLLLPHFLDINRLGSGGKAPYQGGQPDSVTYAEAASEDTEWPSRSQTAKSR